MGKTWRELTGGFMGNNPPKIMGTLRINGREYKQNDAGTFDEVVNGNFAVDSTATETPATPTSAGNDDLLASLLGVK